MNQKPTLKGAEVLLITILMVLSTMVVSASTTIQQEKNQATAFDIFQEGFEGVGVPTGWLNVDSDGDSYEWECDWTYTPNSGLECAASASYINDIGPLTPDNWLITPPMTTSATSTLTYWVAAQDPSWPADHLEVWISTTGTTVPGDFTDQVDDYIESDDIWKLRTVDLSNYDGQAVHIAFRHCESTNWYWIKIDDIEVTDVTLPDDITPPETTCELIGEMSGDDYIGDVTVTLIATDGESGVNYTMYDLDGTGFVEYNAPFIVSDIGDHAIEFYSVDNAGNIEDTQSCTFSIICPLSIEITGGMGVTITIMNSASTDMIDVDWSITVDGIFVIFGKEATGTIAAIPAGGTTVVKSGFVLGIGPVTIEATAGCAEATSSGLLLLFFFLGL
ncbi:MAG: choice-of-anchor J domain-containing protein [Candidatus Thermoplasmatota archaeon]|nr:choice-of-anchor J domain-containing protein [Candidatus Thermoplasmatota archaeon]MBU1941053.1 choice-of-anchor J domain-containing protein [Candidatus Thermoplasmatota archaeon]